MEMQHGMTLSLCHDPTVITGGGINMFLAKETASKFLCFVTSPDTSFHLLRGGNNFHFVGISTKFQNCEFPSLVYTSI